MLFTHRMPKRKLMIEYHKSKIEPLKQAHKNQLKFV